MPSVTQPRTSPVMLDTLCGVVQAQKDKGNKPVTAKEADTNAIYLGRLVELGLVEAAPATVKTGRPGRPAHLYKATQLGRDRARRALAKAGR